MPACHIDEAGSILASIPLARLSLYLVRIKMRFVSTMQEVTNATEEYLGSYGSKWRIQRRSAFTGRTTGGTDRLFQTTFVGSLAEVAGEIMRVCALRPKLTCTNAKGPESAIVSA